MFWSRDYTFYNDKETLEKYRKYGFKELEENKLSTLIEQSGFDRRELMASFGDFKIRDEYLLLNNNVKYFCGLMDQFMVYLKCFKSISKFKLDINSRI